MPTTIARPQTRLKVFVVEDSPVMRERLIVEIASARETEFVGYAESESEAIKKLGKLDCDAIVLDINLARGSGFGVLRAVRANRSDRPQIIVLTSYAYPYYRRLTLDMGANFFLDKATDLDRLQEIIAAIPAADDAAPH